MDTNFINRLRSPTFLRGLLMWDDSDFPSWPSDWRLPTPDAQASMSEFDDFEIRFELATNAAIVLSSAARLNYFGLKLLLNGSSYELGWDDMAHWHPHVLRWSELMSICAASAKRDALPHPGHGIVLLARFAPITPADSDLAMSTFAEAQKNTGIPSFYFDSILQGIDGRAAGFEWQNENGKYCLVKVHKGDGRDMYTLRDPRNSEFPHEQLRIAITLADSTA